MTRRSLSGLVRNLSGTAVQAQPPSMRTPMNHARAALSALLLVAAVAQPAVAADLFYVDFAPLGPGVTGTVTSRVNDAVTQQLTTTRVDFTDEVRREVAGGTANASIGEAQAEYQRGIGLYVINDFAAAALAFEGALSSFREHPGDIADFPVVADSLFKLAESYFKAGNEEMARATLLRALAVRPTQAPNEASGQAFNQFYAAVQIGRAHV